MDNQIIKVEGGELTRPATVLIEKIAGAVGGLFKPYQMVRVAKAGAEVARIEAESRIEVTEIERRAVVRWLSEEGKRQANIESITQQALPLLGENAAPENVENDWITNFFDKSRIVSDADMQQLWSRVLAGEANAPGSFAKRTINLLSDLDKSDAMLFTNLCGFAWQETGGALPLIFDVQGEIYNRHDINFGSLSHLETLGLIQFDNLTGFRILGQPAQASIPYFGRVLLLRPVSGYLDIGKVLLTRAGKDLARVCGAVPVAGFFEYVLDRWAGIASVP